MEHILLPSKMRFEEGSSENESVLIVEPLHHGYGTTIGNALRRVLMSSLEGSAVTSVKIKGAQHEFSAIEGIKEDVLDIILNLKKLRMKIHSDEAVTLHLEVSGREGQVTAADIEKNADVDIANPELVLGTLTDKNAALIMDITVSRGRGFSPTEDREEKSGEIGVLSVDAMFSPVVNVGLQVENTRVGEITNYDKLIMAIKTDGSISPQEAVEQSVKVLLNHYNWISGQLNAGSLTGGVEEVATEPVAEEAAEEEAPSEE